MQQDCEMYICIDCDFAAQIVYIIVLPHKFLWQGKHRNICDSAQHTFIGMPQELTALDFMLRVVVRARLSHRMNRLLRGLHNFGSRLR